MPDEVIMFTAPFIDKAGNCQSPWCCGQKMASDGGCSEGCCDDYKCLKCKKTVRMEWPD